MELAVLLLPSQNAVEHKRLKFVLNKALAQLNHRVFYDIAQVPRPCRLLVAMSLGKEGINLAYLKLLSQLRSGQVDLRSSVAGLVVESAGTLYSKQTATELAFALNKSGCGLVGNPLIEATDTLAHFPLIEEVPEGYELPDYSDSESVACYIKAVSLLGQRVAGPGFRGKSPLTGRADLPKIMVVMPEEEGGSSNLMDLWAELRRRIAPFAHCYLLSLRRDLNHACNDCDHRRCAHYGENQSCFYGGSLPMPWTNCLQEADALLMLCPSMHNSLHSLSLGFLQQLSSLFMQCAFREKAVFALGVTPYASGDMLANQLIATLCLDYSFYLPPHFSLIETAKDPLEAISREGIEEKLDQFAHSILQLLSLGNLN